MTCVCCSVQCEKFTTKGNQYAKKGEMHKNQLKMDTKFNQIPFAVQEKYVNCVAEKWTFMYM